MRALLAVLFFFCSLPAFAIGVDSAVLEDPALEAQAQQVMKGIRCLVCQNQSIVDSNADLAADLRQIVRERVALGEDKAAIEAYLVTRYGDWVLLRPPVSRATWLLWATPALVLTLAGGGIFFAMHRKRSAAPLTHDDEAEADRLMQGHET